MLSFENSEYLVQSTLATEIMESHWQVQVPTPLTSYATLNKLISYALFFLIWKMMIVTVLK